MPKKGESEGFEDLRAHMERIQKNRTNRKTANNVFQGNKEVLEQVKTVIKPVITAFIEGDRSLLLQSTDSNGFFVSCGYSHVTHIWITSAATDNVVIMMQHNPQSQVVYAGHVNKEDIEKAVKNALLSWYTSIFST